MGRGTFGANLGHVIVTNGDFTTYVYNSATTRPSSEITLGRLVIITCIIIERRKIHILGAPVLIRCSVECFPCDVHVCRMWTQLSQTLCV